MKMQFPESFVRIIPENMGKIKTEKIMFKIMAVTVNPSQITVLQTNCNIRVTIDSNRNHCDFNFEK